MVQLRKGGYPMNRVKQLQNFIVESVSFVNLYCDTRASYPMHNRGRWRHCLLLPLKGVECYRFRDGEIDASEGTVLYIPRGEEYIIDLMGEESEVVCIDFSLTENDTSLCPMRFSPRSIGALRSLFFDAMAVWKNNSPAKGATLKALLYQIVAQLIDEESATLQTTRHPRLAPALDYLRSHLTDPNLTVAELAEFSGMSRRYFDKLFREAKGVAPRDYLLRERIRLAKELLRNERLNVGEVALTVGYTDPYHFSKIFKQKTGHTPTEYKRKF